MNHPSPNLQGHTLLLHSKNRLTVPSHRRKNRLRHLRRHHNHSWPGSSLASVLNATVLRVVVAVVALGVGGAFGGGAQTPNFHSLVSNVSTVMRTPSTRAARSHGLRLPPT